MPVGEGVCPRCLEPIPLGAHFCNRCSTPLTFHATTGPYESIFAEGFAYREASSNPRKPIILIGMWLLWGPSFAVSLLMFGISVAACFEQGSLPWILVPLFGSGVCVWFTGALLFKTTKNYVRIREEAEKESAETEDFEEPRSSAWED